MRLRTTTTLLRGLKNQHASSAKYGDCEICKQEVDNVFSLKLGKNHIFGHAECLSKKYQEKLNEAAQQAVKLYGEYEEAAENDGMVDAGEFSGPALARSLDKDIEDLAKKNGFTSDEVKSAMYALMFEPGEDLRPQCCKNGHVWIAAMYDELGGGFYVDEEVGPNCPQCGEEDELNKRYGDPSQIVPVGKEELFKRR